MRKRPPGARFRQFVKINENNYDKTKQNSNNVRIRIQTDRNKVYTLKNRQNEKSEKHHQSRIN